MQYKYGDCMQKRLKKIRDFFSLSQSDCAESLGLSLNGYANYENTKSNRFMKSDDIQKLLHLCETRGKKLNLNWLFCGEGSMFLTNEDLKRQFNSNIEQVIENSFKNFGQIQQVNNLLDSEMAKILGISENKYIKIATGREKPTIDILIKLKENFNVNIDHFLFGNIEAKLPQHDENAAESLGLSKDEIIKLKQILKNY